MADYVHRPYWWDDAGLQARTLAKPAEALPDGVETVVIGAGYTGLSAALTLARGGRQVVVVDAQMPGYGCSARNGGLIGPSFHKLGLAGLTAAYGSAKAHAILRESMDTLDYLKSFIAREKIDCGLKATGRFRGATRPRAYEAMMREAESLHRAIGLRFEAVPRSGQHKQIGSDHYHGGLVLPDDGHLQPAALLIGLCDRATQAGAQIFAPARVTALRRENPGFSLQISDRRVRAGQVLVATNGYSGPDLRYFHRRIIPIRSAIIATQELDPGVMAELSPQGRGFGDSSRLVVYYRPSPDGRRMIFGGRVFDRADRPDRYRSDLHRQMTRIFPQLAGTGVTHAWSGTVAYSFDHAPHLGVHDGVHYAMGYCGSGVGRANYFGRKIALKMLGSKGGATALDGLEFTTHPVYTGSTWFLPAVLRWHDLADRLGL
jgi:glycine/D-amino acid oxidase-like deaminating enzyme